MQLTSKKNFVILIATILVVGFGLMSMYMNNKKIESRLKLQQSATITPMSESDSPDEIQEDLDNTDTDTIDKDLQNIEVELNNL